MEITGKICQVLPEQRFNGRNGEIVKNLFVIEWTDNGYTQKLCLEVVGADKFDKMQNAVRVGNDVQCRFSVTSREYNGKYYTSATCFYCATVGGAQPTRQTPQQSAPHQQVDDSALPF